MLSILLSKMTLCYELFLFWEGVWHISKFKLGVFVNFWLAKPYHYHCIMQCHIMLHWYISLLKETPCHMSLRPHYSPMFWPTCIHSAGQFTRVPKWRFEVSIELYWSRWIDTHISIWNTWVLLCSRIPWNSSRCDFPREDKVADFFFKCLQGLS